VLVSIRSISCGVVRPRATTDDSPGASQSKGNWPKFYIIHYTITRLHQGCPAIFSSWDLINHHVYRYIHRKDLPDAAHSKNKCVYVKTKETSIRVPVNIIDVKSNKTKSKWTWNKLYHKQLKMLLDKLNFEFSTV